ncbi:hypothetical protein APR04_003893 [Promicromonospora umidemergens]|uniref:Flp pilus assembly protein TadB n=2 Tax=Promicromonospora TaxID=43676 RepID=A0ABP8XJM5_9MICO|nr:hypothetical protein [Promicromonospora umidemergens]
MTGLAGAVIVGGLLALGLTLLGIYFFAPARVDPVKALAALAPSRTMIPSVRVQPAPQDGVERLGTWAMRNVPDTVWLRTPVKELNLLGRSLTRFYGERIVFAAYGLAIAPLAVWVVGLFGLELPPVVSVAGAVFLAVVMFFVPNYNAIDDAKKMRTELRREVATYVEAVAFERAGGSGVRQAMEHAAAAGDHWVWARISQELTQSRTSGQSPWDALEALGDELTLPELANVAHVLRLAGEEGTAVAASLQAQRTALRAALVTDDLAAANAANERMDIPRSLLGVVFLALLMAPAVLRIFQNT